MHSKKFLAAFLALSITAAPQASVMASAENASVQENDDNASEKENDGESEQKTDKDADENTEKTTSGETEQKADAAPVNEEFLQITEKKAYTEGDSILIEVVSANTAYNRLYIGNRTDENKTPVIDGTLDESGKYHYLFYIDPKFLGAKAAYVPGNSENDSWYTDEELYMMLPSEATEAPAQTATEDSEAANSEETQTTEESASTDNSGEGTISKSSGSESDSLWQIGALEEDSTEQKQDTESNDDYRIESLEEDGETQNAAETGAASALTTDGTYKADDFSFSGGTGKTKITCEGITVKGGKTYATIKFSSDKFTKLVVNGTEYKPTSNEGGSYFEIPVTLNTDMTITGTTVAMTEPHDIDYVIHITKSGTVTPDATPTVTPQPTATPAPQPTTTPSSDIPKDGTYTGTVTHVSGTATMFKINACTITVKNGKLTATITLGGTGYDKLFLGTKEEALKADDSKLISYKVDKDGKYTYEFALDGLNKDIKLAARSHRYYEAGEKDKMWYDHTLKFNVDTSNSGNGGDGSKDDGSSGNNFGGNHSGGNNGSSGNHSNGSNSGNNSSNGNNSSSGNHSSGSSSKGSGGSSSGGSSSSSKNYKSNTDGKTSQVDSSAGGLKDGEYGPDAFTFSWSGGTGTHGLNITCDKISVESGQAWAYVTFSSGKWVYLKASGTQYDPVDQGSDYTTFKIPVQLNANNKVVGCTTAMSKPYEIEYTLYFGMDTGSTSSSSGGSSVTAKAAGNSTKLADGEEAKTDAGTVYKDDAAPKITGLEYMSSLKLEHSKMFKIHYYNNDMTVLEITLNDEFGKDSVDLTQNSTTQTSSDSSAADTSSAKASGTDGEESEATEQDYAKLYKQEVIRYLLVPEDKADQIPAGIDKSIIVIQLPMDKTYVASDVALEMIDKIGADKNVSAVSDTADDCKVDAIKEALGKGDITSVGTYDKADLKELVKNECKLAIVPSDILTAKAEDNTTEDTTAEETTDETQNDENQIAEKYPVMTAFAEKLAILKIPMILDRSKDEKDVLAKYEWSKVYGALFGCEKEASKLYESAVSGHSGDSGESSDTTDSTDTTENTDTEQ